jgi:hypothetical protein
MNITTLKIIHFRDRVLNYSISYQWTIDFIELRFIYVQLTKTRHTFFFQAWQCLQTAGPKIQNTYRFLASYKLQHTHNLYHSNTLHKTQSYILRQPNKPQPCTIMYLTAVQLWPPLVTQSISSYCVRHSSVTCPLYNSTHSVTLTCAHPLSIPTFPACLSL